jgi:polyketide synthase 5
VVGHWTLPPAAYLSNDRRIGGPGLLRALASVKTNLGHAQAASGSLGLMKAILALQHGVVPRNLHFTPLPDELARIETKLFVPHEATPWGANGHHPRRAAVSSYGLSGPTLEECYEAVRAVIMAEPCTLLQESIDDASIWFADGRLGDWALLVDRVAGVGVLHRVPRDCRRLFACSC